MTDYRIYVACLASYNNGILHGRWIDCTQGVDHVQNEVNAMLKDSPVGREAEEWAIHDYDFNGYRGIEEYTSFEECCKIAEAFKLDYPHEVIAYVLGDKLCDIDGLEEYLNDVYLGEYSNLADYAEQLSKECCHEVPQWLEYYIDWEKMANDWEYSGDIHAIDNGYKSVYIIRNQ